MSGVAPPTSAADVIAGLQMDAGVGVSTARVCVDSGTNLLFVGSAIFGQPDARGARIARRRSRLSTAEPSF